MTDSSSKPFTGYHMTAVLIGFFGIVIAVNIYMATVAIGSFGGTVVKNSYVASQNYNQWLATADKEAKLGWTVGAARRPDGKLALSVIDNGLPGRGFAVRARAEHPLGRAPARQLTFAPDSDGQLVSSVPLPKGRWLLWITVTRGDDRYRTTIVVP